MVAFSSPKTTSFPSCSISFSHLGCCFFSQARVTQPGEHRRQRAGRTDGPQVEVEKEKGKDGYKAEGMEQVMFSLYENETDGVK